VNPLANTPVQSVLDGNVALDGDIGFDGSFSFQASATLTVGPATFAGSITISSSQGLVVTANQSSSGSWGCCSGAFGYSYSEDLDLTFGIKTSGVAYYQASADISGSYTIFWVTTDFNDPYSSSGQVDLGQLVQTLESGVLGVWNDVEGVITWLENNI
jgi:hypothetical protein